MTVDTVQVKCPRCSHEFSAPTKFATESPPPKREGPKPTYTADTEGWEAMLEELSECESLSDYEKDFVPSIQRQAAKYPGFKPSDSQWDVIQKSHNKRISGIKDRR